MDNEKDHELTPDEQDLVEAFIQAFWGEAGCSPLNRDTLARAKKRVYMTHYLEDPTPDEWASLYVEREGWEDYCGEIHNNPFEVRLEEVVEYIGDEFMMVGKYLFIRD